MFFGDKDQILSEECERKARGGYEGQGKNKVV